MNSDNPFSGNPAEPRKVDLQKYPGLAGLFRGNEDFVEKMKQEDPEYFQKLAAGQKPEFLWIGCADSRVPATEITNQQPGSIFVHRNIANVFLESDTNAMSVAYFAVKYLKVKHIIVCGHSSCGGIMAAMSRKSYGYLDNWLNHLKDIYLKYEKELTAIDDEKERADAFGKYNVIEQVRNLSEATFIQESWRDSEFPVIHGFFYDVADGHIQDLGVSTSSADSLEPIYRVEFD